MFRFFVILISVFLIVGCRSGGGGSGAGNLSSSTIQNMPLIADNDPTDDNMFLSTEVIPDANSPDPDSPTPTPNPEPSSLALLGIGLLGLTLSLLMKKRIAYRV